MPRKDPDAQKAYWRAWYAKNAERVRGRIREYKRNNPEKIQADNVARGVQRYVADPAAAVESSRRRKVIQRQRKALAQLMTLTDELQASEQPSEAVQV